MRLSNAPDGFSCTCNRVRESILRNVAVTMSNGDLYSTFDGRRIGGGPCAIVNRRDSTGMSIVHGTCILQRIAELRTEIDTAVEHRLELPENRSILVRIVRHTMTSCGPEIVRFEGPGSL